MAGEGGVGVHTLKLENINGKICKKPFRFIILVLRQLTPPYKNKF